MPLDKNNKTKLSFFRPETDSALRIPYFDQGVSAGFPSPALDFMETTIDLNTALSENPLATFFIKVDGNSMINAGIADQDVLVVDKSIGPEDNKIAICFVDGEFTVKRLKVDAEGISLMPENPNYPPIRITEENQFMIWGIVTYVIKKL